MDSALDTAKNERTDIILNFTPSPTVDFYVKSTDRNPSMVVQFKIPQT
jgi:hypothetical protein